MSQQNRIVLEAEWQAFIQEQVKVGNFVDAAAVLKAALKLLKSTQDHKKEMKQAFQPEQEDRWNTDFSRESFVAGMRQKSKNTD